MAAGRKNIDPDYTVRPYKRVLAKAKTLSPFADSI
jgi:hypothetical protein